MYTTSTTVAGSHPDPKFTVADILTSMASGGLDLPSPDPYSSHSIKPNMWQSHGHGQHMDIHNSYDNGNSQLHNTMHQNVQYNGQNQGHSDPTWFSEASFMSAIPAGNTPTLTPTTLSNIEQTFIELQSSVPSIARTGDPSRQSGFVPPVVDPRATATGMTVKTEYPDYYDDIEDSLSSDKDWMPSVAKRSRPDDQSQTSVISFAQTLSQVGSPSTSTAPQRKTPGRRGRNDVLPPEEDAKRRLRRERNKLAAAKCRQRRVDHTNVLLGETEELEDKRASLENEIQQLQQQKEQLEFLLKAHKPVCTAVKLQIKPEPEDDTRDGTATTSVAASDRFSPLTQMRPNSLPLSVAGIAEGEANTSQATGVVISTPSNGFFPQLGLDSMRDGHTGLTPITGPPSGGCAREVKRNSSDSSPSDGISSPTRLMAL